MQVTHVAPSMDLAPFIARFTVVETSGAETRQLLPDTGLVLGVRYAGAASVVRADGTTRMPDLSIAGIQAETRRMHTHADSGVVLATFRPGAAAACVSTPLHALHGQTVALADVLPPAEVAQLAERVAFAPDHARRIAALEAFLRARLARPIDPLAMAAIRAIEAARGAVRIASLARTLGISQDPLEKRFRQAVGASPKQLASLVRVRHAIELGRAGGDWARVAHATGFFDQSHFIRAFRAVTGQAPERFFRETAHC